jgi:hypothetical protein
MRKTPTARKRCQLRIDKTRWIGIIPCDMMIAFKPKTGKLQFNRGIFDNAEYLHRKMIN